MEELLSDASKRAIRYLESLGERRVFPAPEARDRLAELEFEFPDGPTSPEGVLATLDGSDQLLRVFPATDDVSMFGNSLVSSYVSYVPSGEARLASGAFQAGTIQICSGDAGRKLILSSTGRARIERVVCS